MVWSPGGERKRSWGRRKCYSEGRGPGYKIEEFQVVNIRRTGNVWKKSRMWMEVQSGRVVISEAHNYCTCGLNVAGQPRLFLVLLSAFQLWTDDPKCSGQKMPDSWGRHSEALETWVLGILRGEGLGEGLGKGGSVYKQPETKVDGSCHS